jgi:hypothetical protein
MIEIEGEPTQSEAVYRTIGVVFCIVYGIFFCITIWRMFVYIRCTYDFDFGRHRSSWITLSQNGDVARDKKLAVHIALAFFSSFEVAYGAYFITKETWVHASASCMLAMDYDPAYITQIGLSGLHVSHHLHDLLYGRILHGKLISDVFCCA